MKLAIFQAAGTPGDVAANLKDLAKSAQQAAQQGAEFLILPELFLTGYHIGDLSTTLAEPMDGSSFLAAAQIARQYQIALLFGYCEAYEGKVYNSSLLIDATGQQLGNYRKIHRYGPEERRLYQPGSEWLIATVAGIRVGVLICYDVEFPEAVRHLVRQGAQLIAVPTALECPTAQTPTALEVAKLIVPARALENQVFVAYVNHAGSEGSMVYCGLSCVVGPDGKELVRAGSEEALFVVEIDPSVIPEQQSVFSYLDDSRPELY